MGALPAAAKTGRPRRYCKPECRERAKLRKRSAQQRAGWGSRGELRKIPTDTESLQRQALVALARQLDGAPAAPPEDQLAAALVEARQLAFQLRRIAEDVAPQLRARALALAAAIGDALRAQFGGLV